MRRFYAPIHNFVENGFSLDHDQTRHLRDVLRLRVSDEVRVFDAVGREFRCLINSIEKRQTILSIIEETQPAAPESPFEITLVAAVLKGEKFDLVIQKAVELGVATLVPLQTVRGDVKIKDVEKRMDRWRRIVLEATKQCGRSRLMRIADPTAFDLKFAGAKHTVLFSERGGGNFSTIIPGKKITAIVGPEGGWDDSELAAAISNNIPIVTLGGRILRAETAAVSIAAILQHRFGDLK